MSVFKNRFKGAAIKIALEQVIKSPRKRLPELFSLFERNRGPQIYQRLGLSRPGLERYALKVIEGTDPEIIRKIAEVYLYSNQNTPQGAMITPDMSPEQMRAVIDQGRKRGYELYLFSADSRWGEGDAILRLTKLYPQTFFACFCAQNGPSLSLVSGSGKNLFFVFSSAMSKEQMAYLRRERRPFAFCCAYIADPKARAAFIDEMAGVGAFAGFFLPEEMIGRELEKPFQTGRTIPVFVYASILAVKEELRPSYWNLPEGDWSRSVRGDFSAADFFPKIPR